MGLDKYTFGVALFASLGTFLYGYDTGIVTTTIAHPSWVEYMHHPNPALVGAVGAIYIGGEAVGSLIQIAIADRLGRLRFMQLLCVIVTAGCIIQTAAVNMGMLLAGRILTGIAVGSLAATVPVYLSEISDPRHRGLIGGLSGVNLSCGIMVSNWVGFACNYAPYGQLQWRLPLGLQIPWGVVMFIGLATFMPNSPRHLLQKGKVEEARTAFVKIRRDLQSHEVQQEFALMTSQIAFEHEQRSPSLLSAFKRYRHRVLVSISVQVLTAITGVNVIQYYQTTLYKSLGIESKTILALTAVWGTCAFLSSALSIPFLPDRIGRRKMLLAGVLWVAITEIYAAVMQREFQNTDNRVGKGFAILGIYVFTVGYYSLINPVTWLYGAEVLPVALRNKFMGFAAFAHYAVNVGITEAGPSAFQNIHENYYYVFVGCCAVYFFIIYFYYPETKQKTLEEIAAAFGDEVVEVDVAQDTLGGKVAIEAKVTNVAHIEDGF
ncbi:hypothetical protein AYL99_08094 [Fonsecaea erecta]|uniref:Major facilitator superfamily (MFS) profile domain-containing protein n=1 Tax=Fonsecaea erecta TaxID=1367422 RepID=A0A178ZD07_9EURO|nr:hypothetical protein AYL99_08094 [Fonsecaea erecta]OAP57356.1 hypothetical protein AYL99_08094 [Fonsecaea erecta]